MTIDAQILRRLRLAGDAPVSGAELAEELGISRAAIWARIEELRALGYEIQASPHGGYRLKAVPDVLNGDDIMAILGPGHCIGRDIRVFQETTSTNDLVERFGRDGVKEGVVVFAESQKKGRGRLGRQWVSSEGKGLWFSVLLRPSLPPQSATQVTVIAATAVARALRTATKLQPEIKWPNDIQIRGRKICGILTEMSAELDKIKYVVLGIGLNVNFGSADFPPEVRPIASSVRIETGQAANRAELAAAMLRELDFDYQRISTGRFEEVADEWEAQCNTLGNLVEIHCGDRSFFGTAESLDNDGALLVRTEHGRLERVVGGDVTLRKKI